MQRRAGRARLEAADLAAAADDVVVQDGEVPQLAGVAGLAVVELAVHDDAHAEAPADVDEDHVAVGLLAERHEFAVGHGAGVVLDGDGNVEFLLEDAAQREVVADEIGEAVALLGVDAAGEAHAHAEDLDPGNAAADDLVHDHAAHGAEGVLVGHEHELDVLDIGNDLALEIADGDVEMVARDVHAHEIAGIRVEAVHARATAAGGAHLAFIFDKVLLHEFGNELGDGGDADSQRAAEVGDAIVVVSDAQTQDFPLHSGALAGGVVEKRRCHSGSRVQSVQKYKIFLIFAIIFEEI